MTPVRKRAEKWKRDGLASNAAPTMPLGFLQKKILLANGKTGKKSALCRKYDQA